MLESTFKNLSTGDIIRNGFTGERWIVTSNYGDRVTAVQTVDMTNPSEWELVLKAKYEPR